MKKTYLMRDINDVMTALICYNDLFRKTDLRNTSDIGMTKKQMEVLVILNLDGPSKMCDISRNYLSIEAALGWKAGANEITPSHQSPQKGRQSQRSPVQKRGCLTHCLP